MERGEGAPELPNARDGWAAVADVVLLEHKYQIPARAVDRVRAKTRDRAGTNWTRCTTAYVERNVVRSGKAVWSDW